MKLKSVETVTNNEDFVRLRIFDGDLQVGEAAGEIIRLERAQNAELRRQIEELRVELRRS